MNAERSSITQLIRRAREMDVEALDDLLQLYRNYLNLLAGTWIDGSLRGKADASDLVQDTLLKAYQRFDQFAGHSEPEMAAWLRQILARNMVDLTRRFRTSQARQVSREQSLEAFLDRSSAAFGRLLPAGGSTPSQRAARREMGVVLADALASLNEDYRGVIVLRNLRELEWDDIADRMNRSTGAVRMLWARALKQLRPQIESRL